jgi:hypothetical protein
VALNTIPARDRQAHRMFIGAARDICGTAVPERSRFPGHARSTRMLAQGG